ncbi:hypothetical protein C1A38_18775, partial [Verrucosispora sp. ts21]
MVARIRAVRVVTTEAGLGEDATFVALHTAGAIGWYGPVAAEIGCQAPGLMDSWLAGFQGCG